MWTESRTASSRFAAEGATIVAEDSAAKFVSEAFAKRARFEPDRFARSGKKAKVEEVADKRVLTDGDRVVELHHIAGNFHTSGFLMAYLPKEKILIQADAFTPPAPNQNVNPSALPFAANLMDNIQRLNLAVDRILPIHGRMVPFGDLAKALGQTS